MFDEQLVLAARQQFPFNPHALPVGVHGVAPQQHGWPRPPHPGEPHAPFAQ